MNKQLKVKKISSENSMELIKDSQYIIDNFKAWVKQAVIVSALNNQDYNTTDNLIELWELLWAKNIDYDKIKLKIEEIRDFHLLIAKSKWTNNIEEINEFIIKRFYDFLMKITFNISSHYWIKPCKDNDYLVKGIDMELSVLWFWELISSEIQSLIINNLNITWLVSKPLDFSNSIKDIDSDFNKEDLINLLSENISNKVNDLVNKWVIPVISWYMPWFKNWFDSLY